MSTERSFANVTPMSCAISAFDSAASSPITPLYRAESLITFLIMHSSRSEMRCHFALRYRHIKLKTALAREFFNFQFRHSYTRIPLPNSAHLITPIAIIFHVYTCRQKYTHILPICVGIMESNFLNKKKLYLSVEKRLTKQLFIKQGNIIKNLRKYSNRYLLHLYTW